MTKRRKQRAKADSSEHARDLETIRIVNSVLAEDPVRLSAQAKILTLPA